MDWVKAECPKCGDDVWFWVHETPGHEWIAVESARPCACRLGIRQDQVLRDRGQEAVDQFVAARGEK